MITVKHIITGGHPDDDICADALIIEIKYLLNAISGSVDSDWLWQWIEQKAKENAKEAIKRK